jgi:hypothetical protein
MASKTVRIEGLDELVDTFSRAGGIIDRVIDPFLKDMGDWGVLESQKEILNAGSVDTNELVQGMNWEIQDVFGGIQVVIKPSEKADAYAWYVEEGSPPHKAPIDALQGWADRHGIPVGAVWYKIATEGTEPRKMFYKTFGLFQAHVDKEIPRFVDDIIRRL